MFSTKTLSNALSNISLSIQELRKTVYMICKSDEDDRRPMVFRAQKHRNAEKRNPSPSVDKPTSVSPFADRAERERLAILEKEYHDMKDQMSELRYLTALQHKQHSHNQISNDALYIAPLRSVQKVRPITNPYNQPKSLNLHQMPHSAASDSNFSNSESKKVISSTQISQQQDGRIIQQRVRT